MQITPEMRAWNLAVEEFDRLTNYRFDQEPAQRVDNLAWDQPEVPTWLADHLSDTYRLVYKRKSVDSLMDC